MATAKLTTSRKARAAEIATSNILPILPDGRFVIVGKRDFYFANTERCSCGDSRYKKMQCKHILALIERAH